MIDLTPEGSCCSASSSSSAAGSATGRRLRWPAPQPGSSRIWLIAAGVSLWVGVARAGYPVADEVPYFLVVFAVPAAAAGLLWWRFSRG